MKMEHGEDEDLVAGFVLCGEEEAVRETADKAAADAGVDLGKLPGRFHAARQEAFDLRLEPQTLDLPRDGPVKARIGSDSRRNGSDMLPNASDMSTGGRANESRGPST